MEVNYEKLLQQSNQIKNHIKSEIAEQSTEVLNWKESPKKWSVLQVVDHLNLVYDIYLENFEKAINDAPVLPADGEQKMQRTFLGRLSIYANKPKGNKRRFKMKTFDFFQPIHKPENTDQIINEFLEKKERFNGLIKAARLKDLKGIKIPTALGEKMKFFIPECFEFLLAHEERHVVQIASILEATK